MLRSNHRAAVRAARASRAVLTRAESTFSQQSKLPRFPVPKLEDTARRYLKSVEPLLSAEEYKATEKAVGSFVSSSGLGPTLQERLYALDKAAPYSWLEDIWLNKAYLEWREPSYINVNWAANLGGDIPNPPPAASIQRGKPTDVQFARAARITTHMLETNDAINNETFIVDKARGEPLDMDQFKLQFGTTRIPKRGRDEISSTWPSTSPNILLMYRNVEVAVPVYNASGERASTAQIEQQLRSAAEVVDAQIAQNGPQPSVANLTAAHRDLWSAARETLVTDATNAASLATVENALFGVCLDVDVDPATLGDADVNWATYMHSGTDKGSNRWFDKAIELVFLQNGRMGACCEHTPVDALTTGRLIFEAMSKEQGGADIATTAASGLAPPETIKWNLTPSVVSAIEEARETAGELAANLRLKFGLIPDFGSKWIKTLGVSPDAFFQVALQAAYLREHGAAAATYESANLRKFLHGRTETIRSCTTEAQAFARALDDPHVDAKRKVELFKHAAGVQTALTLAANAGEGVDRHLLGLRVVMRPDELDRATLFNDPAYARSSTFILSTSNTGAGDLFRGGFAPVASDGYGVNYAVDPKNIKTSISDWRSSAKTDAPRFADTVSQTLNDVHKLGVQFLGQ
jgi:carnitine O-acetyltransferase